MRVRDVVEAVIRKRRVRKGMGTIVEDLMTKDPITVRADDTLQTAVELMDANRIKRLIVADENLRVRGIVSRADLFKLSALK